ncbi:MAG: 3-hydroxyacyl-CoA dehydrogenase family protein [Mycobacterium sp.]|nr:3-hydroxyacyl-CoA dehydrogenase family protein [Mycobacterium sp.]
MSGRYTHTFDDIRDRPVAVIGAGTLGRRVALMFASRGGIVRIFAPRAEQRCAAIQYVTETLPKVVADRGFGELGGTVATGSLEEALEDAWLVIESVPEKLEIKIETWRQIDAAAPSDTIFGTNSSSYPSRLMAENIRDKTRLCNTHFYMPPEVNALDLMSDGETDRGLLDTLLTVLPEFGVYPFEARKECTGFIFNRVWAAIKRESLAVVAEGVARPEDVDGMYKLNLGAPAGPFQLMDLVGLDVALDIENHYVEEFPHLPKGPRDLLQTYVDEGKLGVKTGEGFYSYGS